MSTAPPLPPPPITKAPPPPPPIAKPSSNGAQRTVPTSSKRFGVSGGIRSAIQRTVVFGPGGVGKSELCANLKHVGINPLFLDIGDGTRFLDVDRIDGVSTWDDLRAALNDHSLWKNYGAVVIDDLTKAQELCEQWVIQNVPHDKQGKAVTSIESYGYGKGLVHVYETFLNLLADLDAHVRDGRHVVCIAHECTAKVPNPAGENWIRFEPRLQSPESGKNSIRLRLKEWTDHLLFVGYDVFVDEGKGQGAGTRTIHPTELPTHMAKSRNLASPIVYQRGSAELWKQIFGV